MMSEKRFEKGFTKIGHRHCIFENGKETNMTFHWRDDNISPYGKDDKSNLDRVVDKLNGMDERIHDLEQDLEDSYDANGTLEAEIIKLRKENEQLKKRISNYIIK